MVIYKLEGWMKDLFVLLVFDGYGEGCRTTGTDNRSGSSERRLPHMRLRLRLQLCLVFLCARLCLYPKLLLLLLLTTMTIERRRQGGTHAESYDGVGDQ